MDDAAPMPPKKRVRREPAPTTPDPIEIAMEAEARGERPTGVATRVLEKHERLIGWQIASERAGFALKVLTALAGIAAAAALGVLVWQAKNAGGLLVEPFSVPPELAARGLTGEVMASRVIDRLAGLTAETDALRRPDSYSNDWGNDLNVAIPATGVSLGELQTALKQWLGHETRIRGEVYRDGEAIVLSGRVTGKPGFAVRGEEAKLSDLVDQAALQVFHQTQPYRYGVWLNQHGREDEGLKVLRELAQNGPNDRERAWAYRGLSFWLAHWGDQEGALEPARQAVALHPSMAQGWWSLARAEWASGHGEAALSAIRRGSKAAGRDPDLQDWGRDPSLNQASEAEWRGDYASQLAYARHQRDPRLEANGWPFAPLGKAAALARLHEPSAARAAIDAVTAETTLKAAQRSWSDPTVDQDVLRVRWILAEATDDWAAIVSTAPQAEAVGLYGATPGARVRSGAWHQLIRARAETGDLAGAVAMLEGAPQDCDRCLISRARVAAMGGDWRAAEGWFAKAVAAAPSLPQAHHEWARLLLKKGDAAAAAAHAKQAVSIEPRFVDAQLLWGEALLQQGDAKAAATKFAEAGKLAPRWGRLHLKWGEALAKLGRASEAREQWAAAAGLYLTEAERGELVRVREAT